MAEELVTREHVSTVRLALSRLRELAEIVSMREGVHFVLFL